MLKGLILRLKSQIQTSNGLPEKENERVYLGRISVHNANMFKDGQRVITVAGIGTIVEKDRGEIITSLRGKDGTNNKLRRRDKKENLFQYYIFNETLKKMLPLNFSDYNYILLESQPVLYRITNRGFAKIIQRDKQFYEFAEIVNKTKNGKKIYQELKAKGYELKKQM